MFKQNLISLLIFFAILMSILGLYIVIRERIAYRGRIRSRLATGGQGAVASEADLAEIRQSRSLTSEGHYAAPLISLNRLLLQSGTSLGFSGVILIALACAATAYLLAYGAGFDLFLRIPAAIAFGFALPVIILRAMREGRQKRFEEQLPDAIDTIVRSIRAGHAISAAIASVAKRLPDPIGSEFRLTAAEMTYGLDLETAMVNLHSRVGQTELGLLSLAMSIQSKTGGNLAEVLSNLSRVIRERLKLRRKAYALTAEGRFSALILSTLPILLFIVISFTSPSYYAQIWDNAYTKPALSAALIWMLLGDYIMYRMVRIRV
jgi:tight adherence protein B